ncbi:MAG: aminotransferase class III-fold pyridoxal phosphate-dependent enzyme, partial [Rickettsiales bacterium]
PHILQGGKGIYVYDDTGKEFIEGMAGLWCTSLGYGEERLIDVATQQLRKLAYSHLFAGKSHDPAIDLAERLIEMAPVPMSKVFFNNSGSEGNDTVVKLVWYYNNAIGILICRSPAFSTPPARITTGSGKRERARRISRPAVPRNWNR